MSVVSGTSTSLNLRALLKSAASRAGLAASEAVSGLPAPAKALLAAAVAQDGLVVLVVPTDADVEQMSLDVGFFLAGLEGMTAHDIERVVLPFPSHEVDPYRGLAPHFDVVSSRARALHGLAKGSARVVVASAAALLPRLSRPARLLRASIELSPAREISPTSLADLLVDGGFTSEDPVDQHGEFCVRGGVVDFFPAGDDRPVRLEFVGDTIESVRRYDPATQRSVATLDQVAVVPLREVFEEEDRSEDSARPATVFDYLASGRPPSYLVSEPEEVWRYGTDWVDRVRASHTEATERGEEVPSPQSLVVEWSEVAARLRPAVQLEELEIAAGARTAPDGPAVSRTSPDASPKDAEPVGEPPARPARHVACQPAVEFRGRVGDWVAAIRLAQGQGETVLFVADTPGRAERIVEVLADLEVVARPVDRVDYAGGPAVLVTVGQLSRGFRLPAAGLQIFTETDVFGEERRTHERHRTPTRAFLSDFRDLKTGDLVVHVEHGIGVFVGLRQIDVDRSPQEFMELRYAGEDKLFVPVERLDLVQKYTGGTRPSLDRLGGATWERAKKKVRRAMRDMAEELLRLYATRRSVPGHAFGSDSHWQQEFEDSFEYDLTPDQTSAIQDIKRDMEAPFPMDRLLCGDVGYGKTEVAMRAAFKAVMDGKQVALLAPTTVLTFQHLKTFRDRFAAFPVRVDMVSRFRSRAEQKESLDQLETGKLDVIIGTHRLLSKDVKFRDLGLLVVDEEQRFGVAHKERIKQMRRRVDALTMSATPIPRTLNMSLVGIRDMSVIETPPKDRLSIQTSVVKFDHRLVERAIRNEINRGGQVYFVHNRVESIYSIANLVHRLVPEARVAVGHGQMAEDSLERVMIDFVARRFDVLVATTIIENGLDIPNANTMIVNRADRYGLAQLYQLRGRVGRSDRRAYAYLVIPPESILSPLAKKRLAAIREFSDLGSGFRIAALDLEIRGAGNLLGGEQSGHIEQIGFEMYMKLLEQTVRELKGEELDDETRAAVNLKVDLTIDGAYIPDTNQRLGVYRKVAAARHEEALSRVLEEVTDRYGPPPGSVLNLAAYGRIRVMADALRIESIDREGSSAVLKFRSDTAVDPAVLVRLVHERPDVRLMPPSTVRLDLRPPAADPRGGREPARRGGAERPRLTAGSGPRSWWTARAATGAVEPGFRKEEILRAEGEVTGAPGGIFARVADLLEELSAATVIG